MKGKVSDITFLVLSNAFYSPGLSPRQQYSNRDTVLSAPTCCANTIHCYELLKYSNYLILYPSCRTGL